MKTFSVVITEENGWLVALEPVSGVASQGKTLDEAVRNIREALELYFEELGENTEKTNENSSQTFLTTVSV
jgi:predicted RNase H-like HicB family nuclease